MAKKQDKDHIFKKTEGEGGENAQPQGPESQGELPAPNPDEKPIQMIFIPAEELQSLKADLEQAQRKAEENLNAWQRERADFLNYKRRIERDQSSMEQNLTINIVRKYLVVLDDLERALKNHQNEGSEKAWAEGIELIARKLKGILEGEGIVTIPVENTTFDPIRHEALTHEPSPDHKSGEIIEVIQQGYMLGDRIIRPALVRVAQ
jgi:molecular chaperone GrpE